MSTDFSKYQQIFEATRNTGLREGAPSCNIYLYFFLGPSATSKKKTLLIIAITVPLSIAIMFWGAVSVFLQRQRFRERCLRNQVV